MHCISKCGIAVISHTAWLSHRRCYSSTLNVHMQELLW